ncbi:MAG: ABC transporter permease [Proteobacteria bacterium]|nr:ABC transporter permease [Pseudomonadota bacterium]
MTWFLFKGLLRDRQRSLFSGIIVVAGVTITVLIYCWLQGYKDDMISSNAKLDTGHVKIMTRAYNELSNQLPNDLALTGVDALLASLRRDHPGLDWSPRIRLGGLLDFPDEAGETRAQGPVFGLGLDLSPGSTEIERLNLKGGLVRGRLPEGPGEILISDTLARNLSVEVGDVATLISSTARGGMAVQNFTVAGTLHFGVGPMDRNAILADLADVQYALDMEDGAGEVLGFFPNMLYDERAAGLLASAFNRARADSRDEFTPVMLTLRDQNALGDMLDMFEFQLGLVIIGFIFVMSIVLWNAGLMSGIRRYGEVGVRLAIGEPKGHVYRTLLSESLLVGLVGSIVGTGIGLGVSYYMQEHGIDVSFMTRNSSMLMSSVWRARIVPVSWVIGFIPGLLATFLGAAMAGVGIFRRQTSQLFKELET